jgi:formylglycine-generating enzyme required for sulfatase activity
MRFACGRADLVRALTGACPVGLDDLLPLLGLEVGAVEPPVTKRPDPPTTGQGHTLRPELPEESATPGPASKAGRAQFWQLVARQYRTLPKREQQSEWSEDDAADPWGGNAPITPPWPSLATKGDLLARLRPHLARLYSTSAPNITAVISRIAAAQQLDPLPRRKRRRWGEQIQIIADRSRRLTSFWQDQDEVCLWLAELFPNGCLDHWRQFEGDWQPFPTRIDRENDSYRPPAPGTIVLVLGDLGCLAEDAKVCVAHWLTFGQQLRAAGCLPLALMPCLPRDWPAVLRPVWEMLPWEGNGPTGEPDHAAAAQQLLALMAPAIRVEPGLLRQVRRLPAAGQFDAAAEAAFWQQGALVSQSCLAATIDADIANDLRREHWQINENTAAQTQTLMRQVLALIRNWRADLSPDVWFEEILSLPAAMVDVLPVSSDRRLAINRFKNLSLFSQHLNDPEIKHNLAAGLADLFHRMPKEAAQSGEIKAAMERFWVFLQQMNAGADNPNPTPPAGFDPANIQAPPNATPRRLQLHHHGSQILLADPQNPPSVGSPIAEISSLNGLISIGGTDPTPPNFWKSGTAPPWASAWGWDAFGAWACFTLAGVSQRLRWIPPGRFLMGSPEDEPGRFDDEGPQHPVTLSQGFWLFDTPCTQALWQAVMGENPSHFKSPDRPVERVNWDDTQEFITRLNAEIPHLDLSLPIEAQWEYACRAGTQTALYTGPMTIKGAHNAPELDAIAWYGGNSGVGFELDNGTDSSDWKEKQYPHQRAGTHPVGHKAPNGWGLYDMLGNVWEWCFDGRRTYQKKSETDPLGRAKPGAARVLRGGSWFSTAQGVRAAIRLDHHPGDRLDGTGFRCALGQASEPAGAEPLSPAPPRLAERRGAQGMTGAAVVTLGAGVAQAPLPAAPAILIRSDREELLLQQLTRPNWAEAIGRDRFGLWSRFRLGKVAQRLRWIPPGRFLMGSPEDEKGRFGDEGPQHAVIISRGFWLFATPCTQALWEAVMGENPSQFKAPDRPVESVSWNAAQKFIDRLNEKIPGLDLTLPTEAQWEHACRAGTQTALYTPLSMDVNGTEPDLDAIAWYGGNSGRETHPVGQKAPNGWGLYDMLGNVLEWCFDGRRDYQDKSELDPLGPAEPGAARVLRGGSWGYTAQNVRVAIRYGNHPDDRNGNVGFRCACGQVSEPVGAERSGAASPPRQAERRGAQTLTAQRAGRSKPRQGKGG